MLKSFHTADVIEAGCDEAGRGCLAGPVFAAAVILPSNYKNERLNDSKQLSEKARYQLREEIEAFWLERVHRASESWIDHREINMVMLATSLAPDGYLEM